MKSHLKYLWYVLKHKWYVFLECMKLGVPIWGALIHDWQKFAPAEWGPYRQNFFVDWGDVGKSKWVKKRYELAWFHHLHYGPHHWEYWVQEDNKNVDYLSVEILEMPDRYRREMLADWNGAGLAINGVNNTKEFYERRKDSIVLHERTREWAEEMIDKPLEENDLVSATVRALFPKGFKGVCIDVGAYHPIWLSNSYELERIGWDVYCIEPNPYCIPGLLGKRKIVLECAVGKRNIDQASFYIYRTGHGPDDMAGHTGLIEKCKKDEAGEYELVHVDVRTLDWLLSSPALPVDRVDLLLIDTEGTEMDVLRGFDIETWRPKVIVTENIGLEDTEETSNYLGRYGYIFQKRIIFNDIYKRIGND